MICVIDEVDILDHFLLQPLYRFCYSTRVLSLRYCLRCGRMVAVDSIERVAPCLGCGGTNFSAEPKKHTLIRGWELTDQDRDFLRCQGIQPDEF